MNLDYIDIHSHLNLPPLSENQEAILARMRELNVGTITVGTDMKTSQMAIDIAEANPELCFATVGFHPADGYVPNHDSDWADLEKLARHEKVVAIGETGLDYFRDQSDELKTEQSWIFKKHIELALRVGKPLMLHVRSSKGTDDAYYDALEILQQYPSPLRGADSAESPTGSSLKEGAMETTFGDGSHIGELSEGLRGTGVRANFHFFSGSKQCMLDIITAGFTVSVDGPITFSRDYDDMIKACPIESLMIETDAPFAAPVPYRGKPCEPWMVIEVAKKIAELKELDLEAVRLHVLENTKKFFEL
jgi:TatD DNase family protein